MELFHHGVPHLSNGRGQVNDMPDPTAGVANAIRIVEVPAHDFHRLGLQAIGAGRPGTAQAADGLAGAHKAAHEVAPKETAGTRHEDHAVAPERRTAIRLRLPLLKEGEKANPPGAATGQSVATGTGWPVHGNNVGDLRGASSARDGTGRTIFPPLRG